MRDEEKSTPLNKINPQYRNYPNKRGERWRRKKKKKRSKKSNIIHKVMVKVKC
jgi:hypothetical protein